MLKYNIGDIVSCYVDRERGQEAVRQRYEKNKAKNSNIYHFSIVGKDDSAPESAYTYFLLVDLDILIEAKIGLRLEENDFNGCLAKYNLSSDLIGKRIVGCVEEDIIELIGKNNVCSKCGHEIKERQLFFSMYVGCWC